jgi:hypothetical protein
VVVDCDGDPDDPEHARLTFQAADPENRLDDALAPVGG